MSVGWLMLDPANLFTGLKPRNRTVVVAVSGGSDSLALLLLAHEHARRTGVFDLLAVTVDHGLRPEAAAEAKRVAALCRDLGIRHETRRWSGPKPATGVIAAAREARYALLAEAAESAGANVVLTGHTMDDQAETVAMRAARGDGSGLAGMALATLFDGRTWIVRPLLGVRREALRAYLAGRGIDWIDDPTNENRAYERVRVRDSLLESGQIERLAAMAVQAGEERGALARAAAALIERHVSAPAPGLYRIDPAVFGQGGSTPSPSRASPEPPLPLRGGEDNSQSQTSTLLALRALLATVGGTAFLPDAARTARLTERFGAGMRRATLSRCVIELWGGMLWLRRENRNLPEQPVGEEPLLWDGRWRVSAQEGGADLSVGSLRAARAGELSSSVAGVSESLVRAALAVEPALYHGGTLVGPLSVLAPADHGVEAVPVAAPYVRFLPGFDVVLAAALTRLVGGSPLPGAPWKDHIAAGA